MQPEDATVCSLAAVIRKQTPQLMEDLMHIMLMKKKKKDESWHVYQFHLSWCLYLTLCNTPAHQPRHQGQSWCV